MARASTDLDVPKRRLYDIVNVLEGVGLVVKKSKSTILWKGPTSATWNHEQRKELETDIANLVAEQAMLEQWISRFQRLPIHPECAVSASDIVTALYPPPSSSRNDGKMSPNKIQQPPDSIFAIHASPGSFAQVSAPIVQDQEGGDDHDLQKGGYRLIVATQTDVQVPNPARMKCQTNNDESEDGERPSMEEANDIEQEELQVYSLPVVWNGSEQRVESLGAQILTDNHTMQARGNSQFSNEESTLACSSLRKNEGVSDFFS